VSLAYPIPIYLPRRKRIISPGEWLRDKIKERGIERETILRVAPSWAGSTSQAAELDSSIDLVLSLGTIAADDIIIVRQGYRGPSSVTLNTPTHASLTFAPIMAQTGGAISQQRSWWARAAGGEVDSTVTCTKTSGALAYSVDADRYLDCKTTGSPIDPTVAGVGALQDSTGAGPTVTFETMNIASIESLVVVHYLEADDEQTATVGWGASDVTFTQRAKKLSSIGLDTGWIIWTGVPTDTAPATTTWTQTAADEYSLQQFALLPEPTIPPDPLRNVRQARMPRGWNN
jgi:hypothetical protein